ncbi:MAG: nodulation protein NfeD [Myxococcales bacterium]|nr:MAG: nodulation protein NfeD [Myxococcales bacterium]
MHLAIAPTEAAAYNGAMNVSFAQLLRSIFFMPIARSIFLIACLTATVSATAQEQASTKQIYRPAPSKQAGKKDFTLTLPSHPKVVVVPIDETIELGIAAFLRRALKQHKDADLLILDINTLGGRVDAAIQMRDALLKASVPTLAFINPRAISAGALIALSCDLIVVTKGATIGAATPIRGDGAEQSKAVEEKMTSYMRTEMRATAEAKGRRGDLAEAMVDAEVEIKDVVQSGKLLTLDTDRALELGIAELQAESIDKALNIFGAKKAKVIRTRINWAERIARLLTGPMLSGLLMSIGMLALFIALYTQNFGIPIFIGFGALSLFFFGHLIVHLAGWEELALFTFGTVMLALEAFVIPGFGITGILGILAIVVSLALSLVGIDLEVSLGLGTLTRAFLRVFTSTGIALVAGVFIARWLPRTSFAKRLVLATTEDAGAGFTAATPASESLIGKQGKTLTTLRPAGKASIDGKRLDVVSEADFLDIEQHQSDQSHRK